MENPTIAAKRRVSLLNPYESSRVPRDRAPHANRGTFKRPHFDRTKQRIAARKAYEAGLKLPQPAKYRNSSASCAVEAPLAMAA